jgi:hypothetical protein
MATAPIAAAAPTRISATIEITMLRKNRLTYDLQHVH